MSVHAVVNIKGEVYFFLSLSQNIISMLVSVLKQLLLTVIIPPVIHAIKKYIYF